MSVQITRAGEYAVRSMIYLAARGDGARCQAGEIAEAEGIPVSYVRKICEGLARNGLVQSYRGAGGGFMLARRPREITLLDVVRVAEGNVALNRCLGPTGCARQPSCAISQVWAEAQSAVETILARYTLADVAHTRDLMRRAGLDAVE